jgi:hypothetical protein
MVNVPVPADFVIPPEEEIVTQGLVLDIPLSRISPLAELVKVPFIFTTPPYILIGPAKEVTALKVIVPVFVGLPTVSVLLLVAVMASLTIAVNAVELPTMPRLPVFKALVITEALISAAPVTVNVLPLRLQLVPGLEVSPVELIVKFCAEMVV